MRLDEYPTPAQTSVFIGDQHIDDATRVQFEIQNPKVPLYGYNSQEWAVLAGGKILVTGNLVVNYRMPGYLLQAIDRFASDQKMRNIDAALRLVETADGSSPKLDHQKMRGLLTDLKRDEDSTTRLSRLSKAMFDGTFKEVSALMRQVMGTGSKDINGRWFTRRGSPALGQGADIPFDIQIAYGDSYGPLRVDILKDCHITGMGKAMSAAAGGGGFSASGMPIFEVYPFIARSFDQFIVDGNVQPLDDGVRRGAYEYGVPSP